MLEKILATLFGQIVNKLGDVILKIFTKLLSNKRIDDQVNSQVSEVKKALEEIKKNNEANENTPRLSPEDEKKLREATRKLTDSLFG